MVAQGSLLRKASRLAWQGLLALSCPLARLLRGLIVFREKALRRRASSLSRLTLSSWQEWAWLLCTRAHASPSPAVLELLRLCWGLHQPVSQHRPCLTRRLDSISATAMSFPSIGLSAPASSDERLLGELCPGLGDDLRLLSLPAHGPLSAVHTQLQPHQAPTAHQAACPAAAGAPCWPTGGPPPCACLLHAQGFSNSPAALLLRAEPGKPESRPERRTAS